MAAAHGILIQTKCMSSGKSKELKEGTGLGLMWRRVHEYGRQFMLEIMRLTRRSTNYTNPQSELR